MAARPVYAAGFIEFPPRPGTLTPTDPVNNPPWYTMAVPQGGFEIFDWRFDLKRNAYDGRLVSDLVRELRERP